MKPLSKINVIAATISIIFCSCKKLIEIDPPKNQLVTAVVFADSADATSAVLGIYSNIMRGLTSLNFGNGAITVNAGFSSDEIYPVNGTTSENELYANSISPSTNQLIDWSFAYKIIYQTNACIEGLSNSNSIGTTLKKQLIGEAKLMRAFFYFNMVNIYGDVPYVTSTDYRLNTLMGRTSVDTIYNHLMADLKEAETTLSANYISAGRVRPNKFAASALLARIFLYKKEWNNAEMKASDIINSPFYILESNLNNVFLPNSQEAIFQLIPLQPGFETAEGYKFIPSSTSVFPKCIITNFLLAAFEPNDLRRSEWLRSNTINGQNYYYPNKYKLGRDGNTTPLEYYTLLRLAEQYFIRAEARAQQNNFSASLADLNAIRSRSGLPNASATDQSALLALIVHERQTELFCEWGHRWFDLKRTGLIDSVLNTRKPDWLHTDALYPIPFTEIQSNPFLIQNPGY